MNTFFLIFIVAIIVFMFYKTILVIVSKILNFLFKVKEASKNNFDLGISVTMQILFVAIWIVCMDVVNQRYGLSDMVFYISFCLIGIFCVIWCYFSWDAERIFVMPCKASEEHRKIKKIVIYSLILIFVLCQGYFQTLHALDETIKIDVIFSVTNYSVLVATIAFDRVMNQICS